MAEQVKNELAKIGAECNYFVGNFLSDRGQTFYPPPTAVRFFDFRQLIEEGKIDGLIIAEDCLSEFTIQVVKICKFYGIKNVVCTMLNNSFNSLYWLDENKIFLPQCEANLIDSCNLNCKACAHFSNIFCDEDIYSLENFKRDVRQISEQVDIATFFLLGGEPFKLKNLDEYVKISRQFLQNSNLKIVTNGLLVPKVSEKIFDAIRENNFSVEVSMYPPTVKMIDEIEKTFEKYKIRYSLREKVETFKVFMSLSGGHNPLKSRSVCSNDACRFLRDGKLYKCHVDALSFKFAEHFGLKNFPASTGVDIYAKNFPALMKQLYGDVELCTWCNEERRLIDWRPENNPKLEDWIV